MTIQRYAGPGTKIEPLEPPSEDQLQQELESALSPGVAGFPQDGWSAQSLLQAAGSALYEAKHGGRGRVAVAPAL